ncbi:Splicing factor U2af small subunit A [Porphyridium purpureum]|uniref:Splicing factor U2af small subunit A n=1 Tax=Porphyridium purpureum TaxID=35688 RepID=A0A5J4Z8C8_PORPP|nr:Splicing factor U2af small subunit A [Porphyridium purpureum]|eukprot:POR0641..scf295_1
MDRDRPVCAQFSKLGACRYGERCVREHVRPSSSRTLLLANMWLGVEQLHAAADRARVPRLEFSPQQEMARFDDFFEDVYLELERHGEVRRMLVCANASPHLAGNVYVQFRDEKAAQRALDAVDGCFYEGRRVSAQCCSPIDFEGARCSSYERSLCERGEQCNYMHVREITDRLYDALFRRERSSRKAHRRTNGSGSRIKGVRSPRSSRDRRGAGISRKKDKHPHRRRSGSAGSTHKRRRHGSDSEGCEPPAPPPAAVETSE